MSLREFSRDEILRRALCKTNWWAKGGWCFTLDFGLLCFSRYVTVKICVASNLIFVLELDTVYCDGQLVLL